MKKKLMFLGILILTCFWAMPAMATELVRQKNVATIICFPIKDGAGDLVINEDDAGLDSEIDNWSDGAGANGFIDCTNEGVETADGVSGWYNLSLTQAEMNFDYIAIHVKTTTAGVVDPSFLIRTIVGDPLNLATTDDGGTINVTGGAIDDVTVSAIDNNIITAASINADAITSAKIADNAIAAEHLANAAIDNATWAADIGTTAHGSNHIALAVRKLHEELNLDHLLKVATGVAADGDLENFCVGQTVMAHVLSKSADATDYKATTDSAQAISEDRTIAAADYVIVGDTIAGATAVSTVATLNGIANNVITANAINGDAITAAKIAAAAIDNATFAADVGTTAYASNHIALAGRKVLDELNLDHFMKLVVVDKQNMTEVVDNTVLSHMLTKSTGDMDDFDPTTNSLEAIRDNVGTAGAGLSAVVWNAAWDAEVESEVDDSIGGGTGTSLIAVVWNAAWDAQVESEVNDALVVQELDHLVHVADVDSPANNSIMAKLAASDGDWSGYTIASDSLEALRTRGDAAWTTGGGAAAATILQNTTIATLATQTSFTLTTGSTDDDAYNGSIIIIEDAVAGTQKAVGRVLNYTGGTKTITLEADPAIFTIAVGDTVDVVAVEKTWAAATRTLTALDEDDTTIDLDGSTVGTVTTTTTCTNLTNAASNGDFTATMKTSLDTAADTVTVTSMAADVLTASALKADAVTEIIDNFETQSAADPTGFKVNVMEVNGTAQTALNINDILTDTGTTLDTLVKDIPTTAEFNARSIVSADYVVVGDTIAGVTTTTTCTNLTNAPTSGDFTATMKTSINTEADSALSDIKLDHLVNIAVDTDWATTVHLDSVIGHMSDPGTAATFTRATDSLEQIRNKQTDIETDTAEIGAAGAGLTNIDLPNQTMDITGNLSGSVGSCTAATVSAIGANVITATSIQANAITDAKVANDVQVDVLTIETVDATDAINTQADTALTDYDPPTDTEMDTGHALLATEAKQDIIDTNVDQIETAVITNAAGVDIAADIIAVKAETASILTDTGTTLQAEVDGIQADTEDIQSRIPAALSGGNIKADVLAVSTSTTAADSLEASAETIVTAAAAAGTLSVTQMTTTLTEATNDHYNSRIIIWTSGVLKDQATDITDYDGGTKMLTYTAVTEPPGDGDTFNII